MKVIIKNWETSLKKRDRVSKKKIVNSILKLSKGNVIEFHISLKPKYYDIIGTGMFDEADFSVCFNSKVDGKKYFTNITIDKEPKKKLKYVVEKCKNTLIIYAFPKIDYHKANVESLEF